MCYINSTLDHKMVAWLGDDPKMLTAHLFCDADFAGCPYTLKSTNGVHCDIQGPNSRLPWAGGSKGQTRTAQSTPDAETDSLNAGIKDKAEPALQIWPILLQRYHGITHLRGAQSLAAEKPPPVEETVFQPTIHDQLCVLGKQRRSMKTAAVPARAACSTATVPKEDSKPKEWKFAVYTHEDNSTCIQILRTGKNQTMKYLERNAGISIGYLHKRLNSTDFDLTHCRLCDMFVDIYTKSSTDKMNWLRM